jgi:phage baseplate assembly protein W
MAQSAKQRPTVEVGFPFQIDSYGRVADPEYDAHVQQMIELVLFTAPGERVNRPEFGCGLLQLIFDPDTEALATATEYLVQAALQRWLGTVIAVRQVSVQPEDSTLKVSISYLLLHNQQFQVAVFEVPGVLPWQP